MAYTALYRRYRPHSFDTLVGQSHVARVLSAAVRQSGFVHAYLFCGPRGTGKTSAARIMARAINCEQILPNGDPCGTCPSCLREQQGESMDIIEIDGASNRGIDEIRDLRERVKYAPAAAKYKVYIIDEVHMLTNDAFNALLKTLEEPPAHVVFILATTAPHKLPLTVLSRCQRFDFHRISDEDISAHLLDIAQAENIALDADAARLIARKAEGGMRDAVSLLDQCSAVCAGEKLAGGDGRVSVDMVNNLLGAVDRSFVLEMLHSLMRKDTLTVLQQVDELINAGKDLRQAADELQEATRDVLLQLLSSDKQHLPPWASDFAPAAFLALMQALSDLDSRIRYATSPRISFELALIRVCGVPGEQHAPAPAVAVRSAKAAPAAAKQPLDAATVPQASKAAASSGVMPAPQPQPAPQPVVSPFARTSPVTSNGSSTEAALVPLSVVIERWNDILDDLAQRNQGAYAIIRSARPDRVEGRRLVLDLPPQMSLMLSSVLKSSGFRTVIENSVNSVLRSSLSIDAYIGAERELDDDEKPTTAVVEDNFSPEAEQNILF